MEGRQYQRCASSPISSTGPGEAGVAGGRERVPGAITAGRGPPGPRAGAGLDCGRAQRRGVKSATNGEGGGSVLARQPGDRIRSRASRPGELGAFPPCASPRAEPALPRRRAPC